MAAIFLLFCLGLAAIYSVSLSQSNQDFNYFKKQVLFGVIGLALFFFIAFRNYSVFRVYSRWIYAIALVLLIAVLFFGKTVNGTTGWFQFAGMSLQPVELAKIALIISLAKFFSNRFQQFNITKHLIVSFALTMILTVPVLLQPDLGSAAVLLGIWFIMVIITGVPKKYLLIILLIIFVIGSIGWLFVLKDYQKERVMNFVHPTADPLSSGYNVSQSIIASGSGKIFGRGLGFGSQSQLKFIPESQTDFIFAVIAEELGLLGVTLLLASWGIVFYRLMLIARKANNDFGLFIVLGVIILFFLHLIVNIGMNLGIMPVTGIPLPLLSYGGSFLLSTFVLLGLAESVAVKR